MGRFRSDAVLWAIFLSFTALLSGQQTTEVQKQKEEIHGTVRDADSGEPMSGVRVSLDKMQSSLVGGNALVGGGMPNEGVDTTDAHGRYSLSDVEPGMRKLTAQTPKGIFNWRIRSLNLRAGQKLDDIDFRIRNPGTISGHVLSEEGQPMPGAVVYLVAREYYLGQLNYYIRNQAVTDDDGAYVLENVRAGRAWRLMVANYMGRLPAISDAPLDPKRRKRSFLSTYYPNSPTIDGASVLQLSSGQDLQGVDVTVRRSPTYCMEGRFLRPTGEGKVKFTVLPKNPTFGSTSRGGMFGMTSSGETEGDGRFRICNLVEGEYRTFLTRTSDQSDAPPYFRVVSFQVTDRDVKEVVFMSDEPLTIPVEISWAHTASKEAPEIRATVFRTPLFRAGYPGDGGGATASIPGNSELKSVFPDAYKVNIRMEGQEAPIYVKDIRYGDDSVLYAPFLAGSKPAGTELRVVVGNDSSNASIRVVDRGKQPVSDVHVHLIPTDVKDHADLATRKQSQQSDQNGVARFDQGLPPGTYYAVATEDEVLDTPEEIHALWMARSQAPRVNAPANRSVEATVSLSLAN